MSNESIRIPIEIDASAGLAQLAKFSRQASREIGTIGGGHGTDGVIDLDLNVKAAGTAALERLNAKIDAIGESARESKVELVNLGNARLPLTSINAYNAAILQIKQNSSSVTFAPLINGLNDVDKAANKTASDLLRTVPGSNAAGFALQNLGRIAQDAPFGFIGIANNINPMLESFQRLKVETGSTGGALKAMAGSLVGAGGLGLAVSLVSAGMILFGDKIFGAGKKAKETDEIVNKLSKTFSDQLVQLTALVGIVQNVNSKYEDKQKALAAINQEYKTYLSNIDGEKVGLNNVADAYDKIIESMIRRAVVKGLEEQISKAVEGTAKEMLKLELAEAARIETQKKATKATVDTRTAEEKTADVFKKAAAAKQDYNKSTSDGFLADVKHNQAIGNTVATTSLYDEKLTQLKNKLLATVAPMLNLTTKFEDLDIILNKPPNEDSKFNKIIENAKELASFLSDRTFFQVKFTVIPGETKEQTAARAQKFIKDALSNNLKIGSEILFDKDIVASMRKKIEEETKKRLEIKTNILLDPLATEFKDGDNTVQKISESLRSRVESLTKSNPILIRANTKIDLTADQVQLQKQMESINQIVAGGFNDLFVSIGEGIVDKNIGSGIVKVIGGVIQQIGKSLIEYGIVKTGLDKILKGGIAIPGGIAIALGISAVALGQLIKNSKPTGFAGGGIVSGRVLAEVGEGSRTSRNNPEIISPLDQLKNFFGGMLNDFVGRTASVGNNINGSGMQLAVQTSQLRFDGRDLVGAITIINQRQQRGG